MTVEEYRFQLAWSVAELARRSRVSSQTIARLERGEPVRQHIVAAIAKALGEGLGRSLTLNDFDGVNIAE